MCSPTVIEHVIAHLGPADRAAGGGAEPPQSRKTCFAGVKDLTHPLTEDFPSANGDQWLTLEDFLTFRTDGINFRRWSVHEHIGTHIDAPIHFSEDGDTVDRIPASSLVVPLAVIDLRDRAAEDADAELTPNDIRAWESVHGEIADRACVAMNSGWDARATGPRYRNLGEDGNMHFPGFHAETAAMLLEERNVSGIGVDTLSVDPGPSTDFPVHRLILPAGRWAVEGLANLSELPSAGATLVVGAPTVVGGTGGPSRIFALV